MCNLEPIVGSVVGILGCKYGDRMDMLHITWRMLQCSACSGSWTIYLMQSLLSSLAMRFSDTAFFQKLIWGLLSDLDEVIHNQSAARRPAALQAMLPCCRSAIFKQPGLLNLHSRVAPSISNLYFKLRKKCRDCRETAAVTADTAADSVNHLGVARRSHQIATRDTFIHCMPEVNVSVDIFVNSKYVSLSLQRSEISGVGAGC